MNIEDFKNDWRITGDEDFLLGARIVRSVYNDGDHEHCVFCWYKLMKGAEGYVTEDGKYWICENCFRDFYEPFGWILELTRNNN